MTQCPVPAAPLDLPPLIITDRRMGITDEQVAEFRRELDESMRSRRSVMVVPPGIYLGGRPNPREAGR